MAQKRIIRMCSDPVRSGGAAAGSPPIPTGIDPDWLNGAPIPTVMAVDTSRLWRPGQVLRVCFLDGETSVRAKVESMARTWEEFANIHFNFCDDLQAEIRISFTHDPGSWSPPLACPL